MASGGKMKALVSGDNEEPVKRRKVAFAGVAERASCSANDSIKLLFVTSSQEMEDDFQKEEIMFDPEFAERLFGDDGTIYGYVDLEVELWIHANFFYAYVNIRYSKKVINGKHNPTDIVSKLKETFGDTLTVDRQAFKNNIDAYSLAFEEMLQERSEAISSPWRLEEASPGDDDEVAEEGSENSMNSGQIVRMDLSDLSVRAWHSRLNPLALFYIEGARAIDNSDPLWEVYVALEIQDKRRRVVGFCNVYRFYHYPDSTRLRISQILVLPAYQGVGYGLHLLEAVNKTATERGAYDITMEEPSISLQKLRDTMDVLRLLSVPKISIQAAVGDGIQRFQSRKASNLCKFEGPPAGPSNGSQKGKSSKGLSKEVKEKNVLDPPRKLTEEVRNILKINKMQFKRSWEQLLFIHLDPQDKELQDLFQESLIQRLNLELFGKDNEEKGIGKQVVDTDNDYDNSKTFIMVRSRRVGSGGKAGDPMEMDMDNHTAQPNAEDKVKALQEALSEREEELVGVARSVARHSKRLGLTIPTMQHWSKSEAGTLFRNSSGTSSPS